MAVGLQVEEQSGDGEGHDELAGEGMRSSGAEEAEIGPLTAGLTSSPSGVLLEPARSDTAYVGHSGNLQGTTRSLQGCGFCICSHELLCVSS